MKIITCDFPLPIQRLYIKRLKHMIWRWECEDLYGLCPIHKNFQRNGGRIKPFQKYRYPWGPNAICKFCRINIVGDDRGCPCPALGPKEALNRAKDFIERFETEQTPKQRRG